MIEESLFWSSSNVLQNRSYHSSFSDNGRGKSIPEQQHGRFNNKSKGNPLNEL